MTVRGLKPVGIKGGYSLSDEAIAALQRGDVAALINSHKPMFGGFVMKEEDEEDDDTSDKDDKDDTGDSGSGDDDDDSGDDSEDDTDDDDVKAELAKLKKRMIAADKARSKAEAKLREIEDAEKGELEKATDRVGTLETEVTELRSELQSERLSNAFLASNKHTWHKPASALKLAQSEGFLEDVIKDDGTVDNKAMGSALDKLAREHEYLVKREGSGSSGESSSGRSGNGKDDKAVKDADRRRAPALSRRGR